MVLVNNIPSPALLFFRQWVTLNRGWGFGAWSNRTCWGQKILLEWDSGFPVLPRRHRGLRRENNCLCKLVTILYENSSSKCNLELMPLTRAINHFSVFWGVPLTHRFANVHRKCRLFVWDRWQIVWRMENAGSLHFLDGISSMCPFSPRGPAIGDVCKD